MVKGFFTENLLLEKRGEYKAWARDNRLWAQVEKVFWQNVFFRPKLYSVKGKAWRKYCYGNMW